MTSEWNHFALGEITELVIDYRGKTPKKLGGDWCKQGYRALSAKNIKTGRIVQAETIRYIDESLYRKWMKDEVQRGDILITSEAPFGQIFFWDSDEKIVLSQRLFCVRIKPEYDARFIYYYMTTPEFQSELDGRATGTTVIGLRQPELMKCIIRCPEIQEQEVIAAILSSIDAKIIANEKVNDNLQQQAAALFESWFVNYDPWDGVQPSEWENAPLGSFVEIKRGGSPRPIQDFLSDSGLRWLKISDVTSLSSPFVLEIKEHIKEEGLRKTVFLHAGELVLSNSATPGIPKILDVDTCIHDGWLYFPKSELSKYYLYLFFKHIRKELVALGNGSVFTNLKTDILKAFPATKADESTLKEFDALVTPLFDAMLNADRENFKLAAMRDALLPKLMSSEIDVSEVEL